MKTKSKSIVEIATISSGTYRTKLGQFIYTNLCDYNSLIPIINLETSLN